ncbi:hypothetical protein TGAM01_v209989 [Trichoderma gamsii]|uniref:Uncharacterized protein n=1 Tax=Trichoderma gamsii TaxID=398673 RepID=A0A2P4ZA84_9HYPO|nr:hypothetical protein TGAM01_v209989 [Trichoderma gamsii]PON21141.1 hypothetical protein TGAM01_v209989 [Trichoderma gamsii]
MSDASCMLHRLPLIRNVITTRDTYSTATCLACKYYRRPDSGSLIKGSSLSLYLYQRRVINIKL